MNTDIPKLYKAKDAIFVKSFIRHASEGFTHNFTPPIGELPDLGGNLSISITSGTVASGTSISTVQTYKLFIVPKDMINLVYELKKNYQARNLEQIIYPIKKQG